MKKLTLLLILSTFFLITLLGYTSCEIRVINPFVSSASAAHDEEYVEETTGIEEEETTEEEAEYRITYLPNTADTGTVPEDPNSYLAEENAEVLGNTGGLALSGQLFDGWFDSAAGMPYWGGDILTMPSANVDLTAQWSTPNMTVSHPGGTFYQEERDGTGNMTISFENSNIPAFSMMQYEVSYDLWYAVKQQAEGGLLPSGNTYIFANEGQPGYAGSPGEAPDDTNRTLPVTNINWRDAIVWCNAYSEYDGRSPMYWEDSGFSAPLIDSSLGGAYASSVNTSQGSFDDPYVQWGGDGYRLPTEGEWQIAAQNGGAAPSHWAAGADDVFTNSSATERVAWFDANSGTSLHEIGQKKWTPLGVHDMSGNAAEWCWDWYDAYPNQPMENYHGPSTQQTSRIVRGGSGLSTPEELQTGYRTSIAPYNEQSDIGFRAVCRD